MNSLVINTIIISVAFVLSVYVSKLILLKGNVLREVWSKKFSNAIVVIYTLAFVNMGLQGVAIWFDWKAFLIAFAILSVCSYILFLRGVSNHQQASHT